MLTYYLLVPFFYFFAYLPTPVLYTLADVLAFTLRSVVGYRKEVVLSNLRKSFPEKSEEEIKSIAKRSYRHLADRVIENIRCLVITRAEINERVTIKNPEMFDEVYKRNQSVIVMVGHIGSWEFGGYKVSIDTKFKTFGIVSLVSNPYFNRMIQRTRGKMGMELIPMHDSKEFFKKELTVPSLGVFISDQSPSNLARAHWTN
ncbi:MAG: lipid biosynthesis acyltransferase, partial [Bacteroidota bacterium]|nr:lipid biosynthesis acyltransferase [Bacteroidota bacterium]